MYTHLSSSCQNVLIFRIHTFSVTVVFYIPSLQSYPPCLSLQDCDNLWWDAFTTEFFEDDAMLTITFCLEDGPKRYSKPLK